MLSNFLKMVLPVAGVMGGLWPKALNLGEIRLYAQRGRRCHELVNNLKDKLELVIVFFLHLFKLLGQIFIGIDNLAQTDKGPDNLYAGPDGYFTIKNTGHHDGAVLREGIGE